MLLVEGYIVVFFVKPVDLTFGHFGGFSVWLLSQVQTVLSIKMNHDLLKQKLNIATRREDLFLGWCIKLLVGSNKRETECTYSTMVWKKASQ